MRSCQPCDPAQTEALREVREVNVMTGASRIAGTPGGGEWLTVEEVCAELKISPRTFYRWRAQGTGPRSKRMAGGCVRVRRSWLDEWLDKPEQDIA
jgi:excisionase family DNA binding protein